MKKGFYFCALFAFMMGTAIHSHNLVSTDSDLFLSGIEAIAQDAEDNEPQKYEPIVNDCIIPVILPDGSSADEEGSRIDCKEDPNGMDNCAYDPYGYCD